MINDAGKHEVKNGCEMRKATRRPEACPGSGLLYKGKGSGDQSWTRISTRCAHPTLAWKPKTNVVPPHCALAWVGRPKGEGPRLFDAVSRCRGFGGARVDEVTRNTHSP